MKSYQHQRAPSSGGAYQHRYTLWLFSFLSLWLLSINAWAYTIQGRFINIDGNGIPGVTVSAGGASATTDASGNFKLDGLAESNYSVTTSHSSYKTKTVSNIFVGENNPTSNLGTKYLVATSNGYRVSVSVTSNGQTLSGATVTTGSTMGTLQSNNYYVLNVSETSGTVTVSKAGFNTISRGFGVNDDWPVTTVWVSLAEGGYKVKGTLVDINNKPVASVTVSLQSGGASVGNSVLSGADGAFEIKGITKETYSITLTAKKGGYKDVVRSDYYVDNNVSVRDAGNLYMVGTTGGYHARGYVLDAKGSGMSSVQVTVTPDGQAASASDKRTFTDGKGYYDVAVDNVGKYILTAQVVNNLSSGTIVVPKEGFTAIQQDLSLSDANPVATVSNCVFSPSTRIGLAAGSTRVVKGGEIEYTVTVENTGNAPMLWTELKSSPDLRGCWSFVNGQADGKATDNSTHPLDTTIRDIRTPLNCNLMNDNGGSTPYSRQGTSLALADYAVNYPYTTGNPAAKSLVCRELGTLGGAGSQLPNTTKVKVVVHNGCTTTTTTTTGGSGTGGGTTVTSGGGELPWDGLLNFIATGTPICPGGCNSSPVTTTVTVAIPPVVPEVNAEVTSAVNQVTAKEEDATVSDLSYTVTVRNETKKTAIAKDVTLTIRNLPAGLTVSVPTLDKGTCRYTKPGSEIQCKLNDMPNGTQVPVSFKATPKKVVPLLGSFEAQLTSQETVENPQTVALQYTVRVLTRCETNPTCDCTPKPAFCAGIPDLSIVFDDTGSMSEEINGLRKATTDFVTAIKAGQITKPTIQLVTFKDSVSHRITTDAPDTLQSQVNSLAASGGADCPEFSTGALDWVVSNTTSNRLRDGGRILLVTDASPPHNADMDAVIKKLVQRGIKVDVLISGDACVADGVSQSTVDAYSQLANETHGYFAKVFEINDGTAEGKKKYEDTARQVLFGALFPTILGVDPNKAPQESTLNVNLTAANTNFNDKSTVTVQKGDKALVVNTVKVISATELVTNVTVPEGIDLGAYDVKVETKLGSITEVATAKAMLEVTQPSLTPDILSITPISAMQNYEVEVTISGASTHFFTGMSKLSLGDDGIIVKSLKIDNKNALTATLEISPTARLGMHLVTVTTGSEVAKSPKELFLVMQESLFAKLKEVTPHRGRQGGMVRVDLIGGNTNFEDGKSEIKFNGRGLTPLAITVQDATHATATLMVADNAPLGFQDVFVKTGDEIAVLLKGFEVLEKGCHTVEGYVLSQDGPGIADIYVATEGQGAFTDATGFYRLTGLTEGEYTLTAGAKGYHFDPQTFYIGGQHACETSTGETANKVFTAVSNLAVKINLADHFNECVKQDGQVTYNVTVTNTGTQPATGVVLTDLLPANTSLAALEGVNCNLDTASCALSDLGPNGVATVKVTLHNTQDQPLINKVTVSSNEYPPATVTRWKCVAPHLSVSIKDTPDPVTMLGNLTYLFDVDLSQYAPTKATGVKFSTRLPQGVEFKSLKTPVGTCDTSQLPAISCDLGDFSIDQPTDISHTTVTVETVLKDAGLLLLTTEATVSAKEYAADLDRERTTIFVPPDLKVDIALVIDTTESMQEEINGVIRAIKQFLAKVDVSQRPSMALVTFKDEVTVKAFTQNLDVLLGAVEDLKAEGGDTCPEASVEALNIAIKHLKDGGSLLFSTDASPYEDADVAGLEALIKGKNMKFNALITGDCTTAGSWNGLGK